MAGSVVLVRVGRRYLDGGRGDGPEDVPGIPVVHFVFVILSFAMVLYMIPALGCGPRDTLMVIVGNKFPKAPIGAAKFVIDVFALGIGVLLGAPFGIGTVLVMVLQAGIFQFACRVCRFEPRSVNHEDIADTVRRRRT